MGTLLGQQGRTSEPGPIPPPPPSQEQGWLGEELGEAPAPSIKHLPGYGNELSPGWDISLWVGGQDQAWWGDPGWDTAWDGQAGPWAGAELAPRPSSQTPQCVWALMVLPHIHHTYYIWTHTYVQSIRHNTLHMHIQCINIHAHRGTLIESVKSFLCNTQFLLIINHRSLIPFYFKSKILSLLYSNQYTGIVSQSPWIFIPKIWQANNCMILTHVRGFG